MRSGAALTKSLSKHLPSLFCCARCPTDSKAGMGVSRKGGIGPIQFN